MGFQSRLALALLASGVGAALAGDPGGPSPRFGRPDARTGPASAIERRQEIKKRVMVGNARLEAGRYRSAAAAFQEHLVSHPDSVQAWFGLGRALVHLGRCDEGQIWLERARGRVDWTADTGLAEAGCLARAGFLDRADHDYRAVLEEYPQLLLGWYELGQLAIRRGDEPTRIACSAELAALDGGERMSDMLDAWAALARGEDAAWWALAELRRALDESPARNAELQAQLIEGRLWLDVDEVDVAVAILGDAVASTPKHVRARVYFAEALRRQGAAELALSHLTDPFVAGPDAPIALPFLARARVDVGDLRGAEQALAAYPWRGDVEWTASRQYLAAARGDPDAEAWAARWRAREPSAARSLAQIVPVGR